MGARLGSGVGMICLFEGGMQIGEVEGIFCKKRVFYETKLRRTLTTKDLLILRVSDFGRF